jgi:hypothetical protein
MKIGAWEPHDWTFGEKPLDCHRIKVGRGFIYLHLRKRYKSEETLWNYTCSFGANSDDSYSGLIPTPMSLDDAKQHIHQNVIPKIGK